MASGWRLAVTIQKSFNAEVRRAKGAEELNLSPWRIGGAGWCVEFPLRGMENALSRLRVVTPFCLCVEILLRSCALELRGDDDFDPFFAKLGDETFWGLGVGDHGFDGVEGTEV